MRKIFPFVFFLFLAVPLVAGAQQGGLVPCGPGTGKPVCELCDLFQLIANLVRFILVVLVPPVATLFFIFGGVTFYTAMGDADKIAKGKKILTSVVVGIVIIYTAHYLVSMILGALGVVDVQWPDIIIC